MRTAVRPGRLVMVGGHSRGVGKTLFIEHWLRAHRPGEWTAVKVSSHRHAPATVTVPMIEQTTTPSPVLQTGRYLVAGAARAFLVRAPDAALQPAADWIATLRAAGANVIVESNRLVACLSPERLYFVIDPDVDDWKPSSAACLRVPHVVLCVKQRGSGHDHHPYRYTVGDGAARTTHPVHRLALSRATPAGPAGADRAG